MDSPVVSIILPCYNEEEWISETIDSVLDQTFEDFELVVIDDGSEDRTAEIVQEYDDPRVNYYFQENQGSAVARNTALDKAKGEYIAIIDADDVWLESKLERQLLFMDETGAEFSFTNMMLIDGVGKEIGVRHESPPPDQTDRKEYMKALFMRNHICHPTVIFHSSTVETRGFDEDFSIVNDHDLYLRIASEYHVEYLSKVLVRKRYHGGNISGSQNYEQLYQERLLFVEKTVEQFPYLKALEARKLSQINLTYGVNLIIDNHMKQGREALRESIAYRPTNWKSYAAILLSFMGPSIVEKITEQR